MILLFTLLSVLTLIGWSYGYRFFGSGRSEYGWLTMGLTHLGLSSYGLYNNWNVADWYWYLPLILTSFLSVMFIRKFNPWGEFFVHSKAPENLSDVPNWMMKLIERVTSYKYSPKLGSEKMIFWKQTGWLVRTITFGLFPAVVMGLLYQTLAPVLLLPLIGAGVAYTNRLMIIRPVSVGEDGFKKGEMASGFVTGLGLICGII